MKNSILNLEGVQVLSRNEQKNVNGGRGYLTNYQCTGNLYYNTTGAGDAPTAMECTAQYQPRFLGMDWGSPQDLAAGQVFPCPAGMC
jgi:hypothetical protein